MAKQKAMEIILTKDGQISVEAIEFQGQGCKEFTKAMEDALGVATGDTLKPEFRQREQQARATQGH